MLFAPREVPIRFGDLRRLKEGVLCNGKRKLVLDVTRRQIAPEKHTLQARIESAVAAHVSRGIERAYSSWYYPREKLAGAQ